jgi:hypothetical protein
MVPYSGEDSHCSSAARGNSSIRDLEDGVRLRRDDDDEDSKDPDYKEETHPKGSKRQRGRGNSDDDDDDDDLDEEEDSGGGNAKGRGRNSKGGGRNSRGGGARKRRGGNSRDEIDDGDDDEDGTKAQRLQVAADRRAETNHNFKLTKECVKEGCIDFDTPEIYSTTIDSVLAMSIPLLDVRLNQYQIRIYN